MLKTQQKFKSEKNNVFIEEISKIALSLNDLRESNLFIRQKHIHTEQARSCK